MSQVIALHICYLVNLTYRILLGHKSDTVVQGYIDNSSVTKKVGATAVSLLGKRYGGENDKPIKVTAPQQGGTFMLAGATFNGTVHFYNYNNDNKENVN